MMTSLAPVTDELRRSVESRHKQTQGGLSASISKPSYTKIQPLGPSIGSVRSFSRTKIAQLQSL